MMTPALPPLRFSARTATSGVGAGCAALENALFATSNKTPSAAAALKPCRLQQDDEVTVLDTWIAEVEGLASVTLPSELAAFDCRNNRLAYLALQYDGMQRAVSMAVQRYGAARIGVFIGTSTASMADTERAYRQRARASGQQAEPDSLTPLPAWLDYRRSHNSFSAPEFVRSLLALQGPAAAICTACSSSAKVFAQAQRMLAAGLIDAALVGGVDSLCLTTLYGFRSLEVLADAPCRPFDAQRRGISIGEAAAFVLLERAAPDEPGICLLAAGESSDAHHMSAPHPAGAGARAAIQQALLQAGLAAEQVDYLNLHGTATLANDAAETKALAAVFAPSASQRGSRLACNSTKGSTGHTLGAAGALEAVITALALERDQLPGSAGTQTVDPALQAQLQAAGVDYLLQGHSKRLRYALSNSFGFGGSNCVLALEKRA